MKRRHPFRKKWGQNFLADNNLLGRIARIVDPKSTDSILEIGPGEGALTERILPLVKEMVAVEIDPLLIDHLKNRAVLEGLKVIHGDVLLQEIEALPILNPVRVIGNIPYNITSPIVFWLIEQLDYWNDAFNYDIYFDTWADIDWPAVSLYYEYFEGQPYVGHPDHVALRWWEMVDDTTVVLAGELFLEGGVA